MCGIAGLFHCDHPLDAQLIKEMTDSVTHRGPDDEGFACWGKVVGTCKLPLRKTVIHRAAEHENKEEVSWGVALGHRRLAIVDLSPQGRQPMASSDGSLWIVFNGEIYNHHELRSELAGEGCSFSSASDTEVILAAFAKWGENCLHRFNGMWAFAIYDSQNKSLFASRDRFGVKPLYYAFGEGRFGFSSEIKQLRVAGFGTGRADRSGVAKFLRDGTVNTERQTLFEGIMQLLPGEALKWFIADGPKAVRVFRYYAPTFNSDMYPDGFLDSYRKQFAFLFQDAVRLRLRSDVPVGMCLSGGLDSSSIVVVASRLLAAQDGKDKQETFTSCFKDPRFDEWEYASRIVSATGVNGRKVFPNLDELWSEIDNLMWHQEEPFRSTSIYAQWNVMRLAKKSRVKVLLDGQGADEVLAGYHNYIPPFLTSLFRKGELFQGYRHLRAMNRTGVLTATHPASVLTLRIIRGALGLNFFRQSALNSVLHPEYRCGHARPASGFQDLLFQDIYGSLQSLLRHDDRNSMAFSIESRTPFLDYRLVELFLQMPGGYKFRNGWTKPFLREAMCGLMPDSVRLRIDKKGFVTPETAWYQCNIDRIRSVLLSPHSLLQLWIHRAKLMRFLEKETCATSASSAIWRLLCVHFWTNRFGLT
jgi:asparagine synthase (glutamine-hydrolysing)